MAEIQTLTSERGTKMIRSHFELEVIADAYLRLVSLLTIAAN